METCLLYQQDSYVNSNEAIVVKSEFDEQKQKHVVVVDTTVFHPQGGGQPSDQGTITSEHGKFTVDAVRMNVAAAQVEHYGHYHEENTMEDKIFRTHDKVKLCIDPVRRFLHMRLHSGGHLIGHAIDRIGNLPFKHFNSCHFPNEAFISYRPDLSHPAWPIDTSPAALEKLCFQVQQVTNTLITENLKCTIHFYDPKSLDPMLLAELPEKARHAKTVRFIEFDGCSPCKPCGGTHVAYSGEVGRVIVKKLSFKEGVFRFLYSLADLAK